MLLQLPPSKSGSNEDLTSISEKSNSDSDSLLKFENSIEVAATESVVTSKNKVKTSFFGDSDSIRKKYQDKAIIVEPTNEKHDQQHLSNSDVSINNKRLSVCVFSIQFEILTCVTTERRSQ